MRQIAAIVKKGDHYNYDLIRAIIEAAQLAVARASGHKYFGGQYLTRAEPLASLMSRLAAGKVVYEKFGYKLVFSRAKQRVMRPVRRLLVQSTSR